MVIGTPTVLNLIPGTVFPVVNVNQYDAGYQTTFLLYKGAEPFNIAVNMAVTIRGTKGDKNGIADSAASTVGSNLVSVTLTEQMTAVAGPNIYELRIVDMNGLLVGTVNFIMMVEPAALGDGTVISDSDLNYAADVLDRIQTEEATKNQVNQNTSDIADLDNRVTQNVASLDNRIDQNANAIASLGDDTVQLTHDMRTATARIHKKITMTDYVTDSKYAMQGFCYNSSTQQFVFLFYDGSDWSQNTKIIVTNNSFAKVGEYAAKLWHANDITYNPVTNKYVVAPSHDDAEVIELNANYTISRTIYVSGITRDGSGNYGISQIAYDAINNVYYVTTNSDRKTYKVDASFANPVLVAEQTDESFAGNEYSNIYRFDIQGCDLYNGRFVSLAWFWRTGSLTPGITRIGTFDARTKKCMYKFDYVHSRDNEPEGIAFVGNTAFVVSYYRPYIIVRTVRPNTQTEGMPFESLIQYTSFPSFEAWEQKEFTVSIPAGKYIIQAYTNSISNNNGGTDLAFRLGLYIDSATENLTSTFTILKPDRGLPGSLQATRFFVAKVPVTIRAVIVCNKAYSEKTIWLNVEYLQLVEE